MAQNDMDVIVYKVLAYLYDCMKQGNNPTNDMLSNGSVLFGMIPDRYYTVIWQEMIKNNLVEGVGISNYDSIEQVVFSNPTITLQGLEYMKENTMMQKALKYLRDIKTALPFIG